MNADKLALVIRGALVAHRMRPTYIGGEGIIAECRCDLLSTGKSSTAAEDAHRAHQSEVLAAVVLAYLTAEGWAQGREEFATRDGEDIEEIAPPTREWAERVAAADNAYLRRSGFEPNIAVVRRLVTDWGEA